MIEEFVKWSFERERCALLVIDMQNYFVLEGAPLEVPEARKQIPDIRKLIDKCHELDVPVIYTSHEPDPVYCALEATGNLWLKDFGPLEGTEEARVIDELTPEPGDVIVRKRRFSAFFQTDLELILRSIRGYEKPVDTVIICGTVTNVCCESTARDAFFRDFKVVFGSDVCSAMTPESHNATLENMKFFGRTMDCETIIKSLENGRG